jgi:hypothetical protein
MGRAQLRWEDNIQEGLCVAAEYKRMEETRR